MPVRNLAREKARELGETTFIGKPCRHGHGSLRETSSGKCRECLRIQARATYHKRNEYYRQVKTKQRAKTCKKKLSEYQKEWYAKNKEKKNKQSKQNYLSNKERICKKQKVYRENNKHLVCFWAMSYKARKVQASPDWLTQDDIQLMECMYEISTRVSKCLGIKHEVDHIVPLNSKKVCGLHVPWNLRVVSWKVNRSKGNKLEEKNVHVS